jgi:hypothetical protein
MPAINNLDRLSSKLDKLKDKYRSQGTPSVVVGYTANYAVYVHEVPAKHSPGKQMKFLEQPAREMGNELGSIVSKALRGGAKLLPALYVAGLKLQRNSQEIVPVDTGNLRASAFTAREDELQSVIAANEGRLLDRMQKQGERWQAGAARRLAKRESEKKKRESEKKKRARHRLQVNKLKKRLKKVQQRRKNLGG